MINEAAQWNASKYFKEMNKRVGNPIHNNNATNQNNHQGSTNKSNNNNNRDSDFKHLDNKARNISSRNNNAGNSRHVPTTTRCSDNIVSNATDCDRKFFNRITYTTCSFAESCVEPETKRQNAIVFRSIPNATSRVKTTIFQRTINSRNGASAILDSSSFYRILFLCLQLCAALFSFTHNIGFALASNVIDEFTSVESVDRNSGIDDKVLGHFTHTWAVHIPNGEENGLAESVARDHGFINRGKIFDDHFHFEHRKISKRSLTPAAEHQTRLDDDDRIHWAKQQRAKSRKKRDFIRLRPSRTSPKTLSLIDAVSLYDPKWSQMWYLNRGGGIDMNVIPAWKEGITGRGIVVTILDDGLESDHPDIEHNYDPLASYDVNSHDDDPMPHYDMTDSNRHGTRCAGEVAATANNSICAVGIAFGASVGGVRMLDGDVTDAVEARSLSLNPQHIDIYSASWGPDDDGKTVDGPGELASRAFIEGVMKGRRGKGSIFIWASGNGGRELDNCNCDGYTNSIWTLSISSATEDGHVPWYSEKCSSTLATTYSSGGQGEKQVVTTDLHHSCTVSHTGTSASAPLAAGIAALVLESNNNLTWRDLQHIVVRTATAANLKDPTWSKNGVGRRISHSFGYGLMDAAAMVRAARTWKTVPEQQRCEINAPHVDKTIPPEGSITLQLAVKHCMSVNYLEHVQAKITLTSQRRGDIQLYLKSPAGTRVTLLTSRVHDNSRSGFNQWPFMSVHTWGESPHGNWQLEIHNQGRYKGHALLREWSLIFYGTTQPIDPSDPISTRRNNIAELTTPSGSSTTSTLHQVYSPLYPRLNPSNMATGNGIVKYPAKLPPYKSSYVSSTNEGGSTATSGGSKKQQKQPLPPVQQGYQQISATYGVILGSQAKNTKGSSNGGNNNNNNKNKAKGSDGKKSSNKAASVAGNKSGANKKNQASVTSTSSTSSNSQKMKLYRILQELQNNNNNNNNNSNNNKGKPKSTTNSVAARPAKLQTLPRQHSSEEKQSRKVVAGDLPTTSTQAASYTKLPIKSTKQVKEKPTASQQTSQSQEQQPAATATAVAGNIGGDQRIPKMFERYNKIQAIFPEFQPYQGVREPDNANNGNNNKTATWRQSQKSAKTQKHTEAQSARSSVLESAEKIPSAAQSKPSRENSKKSSQSFVPDPQIIKKQQQLLLSAASDSKSALREELSAEQESAQITQWDLLFYGTEVPAQPEDTVHLGSGKYDSYGGDMEHNDIEFDASGQWHNMQQIGESSVESHDRTSTACTKTTIDQKCLDCAPPTFLFDGRCLEECPRHTYIVISDSASNDELNHNGIAAKHTNSDKQEPTAGDQEQLLSTDKRRRSSHRLVEATDTAKSHRRRCLMCDPSCYQCYGPLNSQCSTCYPGSQLRQQQQTNETYCNVFAERSTGVGSDNADFKIINNLGQNPFAVAKLLFSVLGVLAIIICFILLTIYRGMFCNRNENGESNKVQYTYDRVALLEENEPEVDDGEQHPKDEEIVKAATKNEQNLQELPRQFLKFVNDNSESEEEVDLFIVK